VADARDERKCRLDQDNDSPSFEREISLSPQWTHGNVSDRTKRDFVLP